MSYSYWTKSKCARSTGPAAQQADTNNNINNKNETSLVFNFLKKTSYQKQKWLRYFSSLPWSFLCHFSLVPKVMTRTGNLWNHCQGGHFIPGLQRIKYKEPMSIFWHWMILKNWTFLETGDGLFWVRELFCVFVLLEFIFNFYKTFHKMHKWMFVGINFFAGNFSTEINHDTKPDQDSEPGNRNKRDIFDRAITFEDIFRLIDGTESITTTTTTTPRTTTTFTSSKNSPIVSRAHPVPPYSPFGVSPSPYRGPGVSQIFKKVYSDFCTVFWWLFGSILA